MDGPRGRAGAPRFDFGATPFNGFGYYNQVINGRQYLLQQEWSNRTNRCVQRGT